MGAPPLDAEDIAQDALTAFALAYREGRYDRARGRLSTWLFAIAAHHVLRYRERTSRRERLAPSRPLESRDAAEIDGTGAGCDPRATEAWDQTWEAFVVDSCLARARRELSAEAMRIFDLVVLEERSPAEASEILGVEPRVVYNAKHRVLERLRRFRQELEAEGEGTPA
jgi:RNA polymerase sigma factor (sigma-70 family)